MGNSSVCVYIVTNNDSIAEYEESVQIIVRPDNPLDVVDLNITFLIIDSDGLYNIIVYELYSIAVNIMVFHCAGVNFVVLVREVNMTEGEVREICVEFAEGQIPAERVVMLSVSESSSMRNH